MSVPKRIGKLEFGLLSPKEIREMSARKIIWADTYDDDGFPYPQGLMDLNLGVIDPGLRCKTCDQKASDCPGHFGHIELAKPVINVGYTRLIRKLLRVTCRFCGHVLLSPDEIEVVTGTDNDSTENPISENDLKRERICPYCGEQQLKINFEIPTTFSEIMVEDGKNVEHNLTPADIRARFEKIPDEDLILLGINPKVARPEWTILTVLPIPPVTMRPSIFLENGQRSEDDLTHKLVDIIRTNQSFKENQDAGAPQNVLEELWDLLQYHVTTYINNEVGGCPPARHFSGRPLKTLSQRLKGKDGRFRGSLSGKRVNFSARTVISPDPNLSVSDVGIPRAIANEMTVPIRVTSYNLEELKAIARNGPIRPDVNSPCGANYVIRQDNRRLRLAECNLDTVADMIEPGWTVERQLRDGDIVLFNRQPSLHRMSIMAHRVKVMEGRTFRLNPAVCPPYNADFDGDEMNLHVPQTEEARAEAFILCSVEENLLSPRFGGPIVGGIQDHISGIFLMTHGVRWFNKEEALYLLKSVKIEHMPPAGKVENGIEYWSNKQVFSEILPTGLNMVFKASSCENCDVCKKDHCDRDAYVRIIDGELEKGTIDKKAIGTFDGQIINRIIRSYGMKRATVFIDQMTKISIRCIMFDGFSFGIDDGDLSKTDCELIDDTLKTATLDVVRRIERYNNAILEPMPGRTVEETLEMQIMHILGKSRDQIGRIVGQHVSLNNSAVVMAVSGARGSMLNLTQMAGCIGQQSVRGERIVHGYDDRTLPHFKKGDRGSEAHGFIAHSYRGGLNPTEFFFHAIGGREGLVDAAVRVPQSGYLQRRMINALQNLKVAYDGTVRTTTGKIIQFQYGEDGTDPTKSAYGDAVDVKGIIDSILLSGNPQVNFEPELLQHPIKVTPSYHQRPRIIEIECTAPIEAKPEISIPAFPRQIILNQDNVRQNVIQKSAKRPIIIEMDDSKKCLSCGMKNSRVSNYCSYCGAKFIDIITEPVKPSGVNTNTKDSAVPDPGKIPASEVIISDEMDCMSPAISIDLFENESPVIHEQLLSSSTGSEHISSVDSIIPVDCPKILPYDISIMLPDSENTVQGLSIHDRIITDNTSVTVKKICLKPPLSDELVTVQITKLHYTTTQFIDDKNYEEAVQCCTDILQLDEKDALAWDTKGYCYEMKGHFDQALECYNTALECNPDLCSAWYHRGIRLAQNCDFTESLYCFDTVIAKDPLFENVWYERGYAFERLEEHQNAIDCFDKFLESDPTNVDVWINKAYNHEKLGEDDQAIKCYESALGHTPDNKCIWFMKGSLHEKRGELPEAHLAYQNAIQLDPDYPPALTADIKLSMQLPGEQPAIKDNMIPESYLNIRLPENFHSCIFFGISLMGSGKIEEALQYFNKAQKIEPDNLDPWIFKLICYKKMNSPIEVKECERKIDTTSFINHAFQFYKRSDYERSLKYFETIIEIFPSDSSLWENKGFCLEQLGNLDEAQYCFQHAKEIDDLEESL